MRMVHSSRHPGRGFRALAGWLEAVLDKVYAWLAVGQQACPADLIFVLAGLPERKRYGWQLFQCGLAPVLLLSVGRSEARFLRVRAGLPKDGDIVRLLPIRPDKGNHIFLWFEQGHVCPEVVRLPELNTFGEIAALGTVIRERSLHHVLILSSDVHLRRIRYVARKLLGSTPVQITYHGVPEAVSMYRRLRWWSRKQDNWLVMSEWSKLAGYYVKYGIFRLHHRYADRVHRPAVQQTLLAE